MSVPRVSVPRISLARISLPRISPPRISVPRISLSRIWSQLCKAISPPIFCQRTSTPSTGVPSSTTPASSTTPKISSSTTSYSTPADVSNPCSLIISRSEWGAPSIKPSQALDLPMEVVVYYVKGNNCSTRDSCVQEAKRLHTETTNYNYLIGGDGSVFEGRGWDNFSSHYRKYGLIEYGVCFIGETITEKMVDSLAVLLGCGMSLEKIYTDFNPDSDLKLAEAVDFGRILLLTSCKNDNL